MTDVTELRVALTVANFDEALAFYRDALGLEQVADWRDAADAVHGRVTQAQGRSAHASGRPTRQAVNGAYACAGVSVSVSTPALRARAVFESG
jgi:catechol 2,3-dioxygenase-like lactoylglutathione lyase family enzyme